MLLASPVTWDITLVLLLVPIAVLARSAEKSRWRPAALLLILPIVFLPQKLLAYLTLTNCDLRFASWAYILGVPSLKFYALLGTFVLGIGALRTQQANTRRATADGGPAR
jgi:hypothetical protein